jgi:hypothetical protein
VAVLERGDIEFFYRPRVGVDDARRLDDVQRFYVVLRPHGANRHRALIVGRKRLPELVMLGAAADAEPELGIELDAGAGPLTRTSCRR